VSPPNALVEQVLAGESFELRVLAAQGILPLPPAELVPLQVLLAHSDDPYLAEAARSSLAGIDARVASTYLAGEAPPEVLRYFALEQDDAALVEAVLRRRDLPPALLAEVAPRLSPDLQEVLLLRQDAIVGAPEILAALETNPRLSPFARRRIHEYREHLVSRPAATAVALPSPAEAPTPEDELTPEEMEAIDRVRDLPPGGETDRKTGLSEHQIRALPLPVRLKLSRGAGRTLRNILIKDNNPNIALAVLANSAFAEDEVEQIAASRSVVVEVLTTIPRRKEWLARYGVCLNLVRNPRTPPGLSLKLMGKLSARDLRTLSKDRNVADAVRQAAQRMYRIKAV
jgi:hypothetical protein